MTDLLNSSQYRCISLILVLRILGKHLRQAGAWL